LTEEPPGLGAPDPRETEAVELIQRGEVPAAEALIRDILGDHPDSPHLLTVLGTLAARQDRYAEAIPLLERAVALAPEVGAFGENLNAARNAMVSHVQALMGRKDWPRAIAALRQVRKAEPENIFALNSLIHCVMDGGERALLSDYEPGLSEDELGRHIVIACMPKSGSTFLRNAMLALTGWQEARLTYAFLQNEEELYLPYLKAVARNNTVVQQHCRATVPNLQMMQAYRIRPVVLVRNLFDVVVSYTDFFDSGANSNTFFIGDRWAGLAREERIDLVIDNFVPWYTAFYASWSDVIAKGQLECHMLRYEDMIADKLGALERLAGFYDLGTSRQHCAAALAAVEARKDATRFNKGVAGRCSELSEAQKRRVRTLAHYYSDIDFSPLGL